MNALCVCFLLHVFQTGNARSQQANGKRPPAPKKDPRKASSLHPWGAQQETFQIITTSTTTTKILHIIANPAAKAKQGAQVSILTRRQKGGPNLWQEVDRESCLGSHRLRRHSPVTTMAVKTVEEPWKSHGRATEEPKCPLTPPVTGAVQGLRSFSKPRIRRLSLL